MKNGPGRIAGMALKHLFKKPATISYPQKTLAGRGSLSPVAWFMIPQTV